MEAERYLMTSLEKLDFNISDNNRDAICEIARNTFVADSLKGFAINGNYDTGKTYFVKKFILILNTLIENSAFMFTANNIAKFYKDEKMTTAKGAVQDLEMLYKYKILIIDDIGTEPPEVVSFGTRLQPISELIQQRYDNDRAIWFTTNLSFDSVRQVYGERVVSRLKEMSYPVLFKGRDLYRGR